MNLKQLEYFLCASEMKNISAAAKKLHMAQPPLSRHLSLLEEELGVTLLSRNNRGIEMTEAGKIINNKGKTIFSIIEEMTKMAKETEEGVRGVINIGTIYSTIPLFTEKIKFIKENYPLIKFRILHGDPPELIDRLEEGALDVVFVRIPTCDTRNFRYQVLGDDDLVLVVHKMLDPVPDSDEIEIEALKDVPLCMGLNSESYRGYNEYFVTECHRHGFEPNIICECQDTSVALALVMQRLGISFQPRACVPMMAHPDIYVKKIHNFETKSLPAMIWNDNIYLARPLRLFLALFES